MTPKRTVDNDAPPTEPADWIGAAKIYRGDSQRRKIRSPMTFHVFRSSNDACLFALTGENDPNKLPLCPNDGTWVAFKSFKETGQPRIGFSESEAKAGIERDGYYLAKIRIAVTETVA